jgi:hypothetical protein
VKRIVGLTSDLRLNNWLEYLFLAQETTKIILCQGKSAFRKLVRVEDFGLERRKGEGRGQANYA